MTTDSVAGRYAVGVDVGGTFTDVCLVDTDNNQFWITKTPTTPSDRAEGFLAGMREVLAAAGIGFAAIGRVMHGTTVATNAILEERGARCALITSEGFRYVLELGRHDVPRGANVFSWVKPQRPVSPDLIFELPGRIAADGSVVEELDLSPCAAIVETLRAERVESVAICMIHSYANPEHERRVTAALAQMLPELTVTCSHEILPTFREYERSMATVLNAYVRPSVARYLESLEARLSAQGVAGEVMYMQSAGGVISGSVAQRQAIQMALSGPAAGVVGVREMGALAGSSNIISIDIGGTSADISLIRDGNPEITTEGSIGHWPLHLPMIDIQTIGAGGGSIASLTSAGSLVVGPRSAGAEPGPACYARGGTEPTVTDANLVLGRVPAGLVDGALRLRYDLAEESITKRVAEPLGLDVVAAALGILQILNDNMVGAIRQISVARGLDPRAFTLMPLGGAGPLHAAELADLLGMSRVIIPPHPGVLSTVGLLMTDVRNDFSRTLVQRVDTADVDAVENAYRELEAQASAWLDLERIPEEKRQLARLVDVRYANQGFELTVGMTAPCSTATIAAVARSFHDLHERLYTFSAPDTPVELTTLRVAATGALPHFKPSRLRGERSTPVPTGHRHVVFADGVRLETPIYSRADLPLGVALHGACVVEQKDTTLLVPPDWSISTEDHGCLIMERSRG